MMGNLSWVRVAGRRIALFSWAAPFAGVPTQERTGAGLGPSGVPTRAEVGASPRRPQGLLVGG